MLNSKSIGNKIALARKKIALSQAELAQQISISPQAVGKWERGESMPDISTLNRLAEILGVDLNYFSDRFQDEEGTVVFKEKTICQTEESPTGTKTRFDWNWDMSQGDWKDADFSGLKNLKEKFSSSNIKNCRFLNSDLSGLILKSNNIERCDFSGSDIRDSKMQSSNLSNNHFDECSFIDATLFRSNIEKCSFLKGDFSGTEIVGSNFDNNNVYSVIWNFTKFRKSSISNITFTGIFENCHFEYCGFNKVVFENATLLNTFFKYNEKLKRVKFVDCKVDSITYAFLQNNQADLTGITLV